MLTICTGVTPCRYCVAKAAPGAPRSRSTLGGLFFIRVSMTMLSILLTRPLCSVTCIVIVQTPSVEEKYLMLRKMELKVVGSRQEYGVVCRTSVTLLLSKEMRSGYIMSEKSNKLRSQLPDILAVHIRSSSGSLISISGAIIMAGSLAKYITFPTGTFSIMGG